MDVMPFKIIIKINTNDNLKKILENAIKYLGKTFSVSMDYKEPIQRKDITYCYVIITPKNTVENLIIYLMKNNTKFQLV